MIEFSRTMQYNCIWSFQLLTTRKCLRQFPRLGSVTDENSAVRELLYVVNYTDISECIRRIWGTHSVAGIPTGGQFRVRTPVRLRDFFSTPFRPAIGPTQPSAQWVHFRGGGGLLSDRIVAWTTHLHLAPIHPLVLLCAGTSSSYGETFSFTQRIICDGHKCHYFFRDGVPLPVNLLQLQVSNPTAVSN